MSDSDSEDAYGPPLPPGLKSGNSSKKTDGDDGDDFMPALPPHLMKRKGDAEKEENNSKVPKMDSGEEEELTDEEDMYGPALPPHLMQKKKEDKDKAPAQRILGPALPKGYVPSVSEAAVPEEESSESEDDGFVIGPTPSAVKIDEEEYRIRQFEYRAKKMKDKLEGKVESKPMQRESWMLELPEDRKSFCGLEARQFRRKAPLERGDQSVWTDTPADKERKARMAEEEDEEDYTPEDIASKRRDEELADLVAKYNTKKRDKPLIDIHKKKNKEKEANAGPKERRPFSREEDLNVNKFDDVQKERILKKARQLNDRFTAGNKKFV